MWALTDTQISARLASCSSLANNAISGLVNASLPSSLERLDLANNAIERIEATELPAGLRFL